MFSIRLSRFCLIVTIVCVQIHLSVSLIVHDGYPLESRYLSSWRVQCPLLPPPKNGLMRIRNNGRTVRFQCKSGYILLGEKRLICRALQWDKSPPQCIKPGCSLQHPTNGHVEQLYQGALAKFACYSGYLLSGPSVIACDGSSWNATSPTCWRNEEETSIGNCDLEKGLCGWENYQKDEFDWKLNILNTPSGSIGTGPSYDHTFGYGKKGHYLFLETSSPQRTNDTAVLISPIFPAVDSPTNETRCFTFWYHMYGNGIGTLNVYLNNTLNFTESGNHGNRWIRGVIPIGDDIFRMKIEGVRGTTYAGDIALDDFAIAEGSACEETVPLLGSCSGRCFTEAISDDNPCYCMESCQTNSTCCSDFHTLCTADYGIPTAQAGLTSSSTLESKSIDSSTESFQSTTTAQLTNNSIDYYSTNVPLPLITTINTNNSTITATTEQNKKMVNESPVTTQTFKITSISNIFNKKASTSNNVTFKQNITIKIGNFTTKTDVTTPTNLKQTNVTFKENFTVIQQTTLNTTPKFTDNSLTGKINIDKELKSVIKDDRTNKTLKTTTISNNLNKNASISNDVTLKQNTTTKIGNYTSKIDVTTSSTTPSSIKLITNANFNLNTYRFDSDYDVFKNLLEKIEKSPKKDHIDSVIAEILKQLKNEEYEKNSGKNNSTTKYQSPTFTTREVTKSLTQLNTTTALAGNFTLKNLATRTTEIPLKLSVTTSLNNITNATYANPVTFAPKLNNSTIRTATTTKKTPSSSLVTITTKYPKLPGIRFKIPPKTSKSNTFFNPRLNSYVYLKNITKLSTTTTTTTTTKPVVRVLTQNWANNTISTQKMNFYTTKNISSPTTIQLLVRATTQATHMSVIKTKVDVSGKSIWMKKNGKLKKYYDKESHAPYVISRQTDSNTSTIAIISVFSSLAIVCLVIAVFTCKRKMSRGRSGLDDDSDVQFLTSDELINFNLARPSPDRQMSSETRRFFGKQETPFHNK